VYALTQNLFGQIDMAEENIAILYAEMKNRGVKIDLVYLFENQKRKIRRLRGLTSFFNTNLSTAAAFKVFVSQLILDIHHQRNLRSFFSENLSLITERIVQSNSELGEHYVTFNWAEFRKMFRSAMGGGAVTAITVFVKLTIANFNLVGFIKGLAESLNYSGSFLWIQVMGWTLATKQPSATAPFIASSLMKSMTESRRSIIALLRTQFIAVLGNLSTVFPICFIVSWTMFHLGHPFLTEHHAVDQFNSTNILGPTALYAAFTGILLFSASLFAGWFENWIILNRLEDRLMSNERLHNLLGSKRAISFAEFVGKNANALAANTTLGFLLGLTPQVLKFFGIPLEVRHITLATGAFAASLPTLLDHGLQVWPFINSVAGLLIIGILNISVSFAMAFLLASVSSKVRFSSLLRLLSWGVRLILTRPWLMIVPEKDKEVVENTVF
jgi:site-specific recombinase